MKVHVSYIVEVTDEYRRALRHHWGQTGMATREELKNHFKVAGESMDDDIMSEYERDQEEASHD